jgi:hypothetical protein
MAFILKKLAQLARSHTLRSSNPIAAVCGSATQSFSREEKILHALKKEGVGIEICPSHRPIAPKSQGFNVKIIDHLDKNGLIDKYRAHGIDTSMIEEVDYIWHGESYAQLTGKRHFFDWIIACHLIEHTPDLIGFICGCEEVLNSEGTLSLAVPDKRYCFDLCRSTTGLAALIDAHEQRRTIHTVGTAAEYFLNVVARNGSIAWRKESLGGAFSHIHGKNDAEHGIRDIRERGAYLDLHAWVFTPHSFRLLMNDLYELGYIKLRESGFFTTDGHEFYIALSANGNGPGMSRLELSRIALAESSSCQI